MCVCVVFPNGYLTKPSISHVQRHLGLAALWNRPLYPNSPLKLVGCSSDACNSRKVKPLAFGTKVLPSQLPPLKLTSHLKIDGWTTTFLLGRPINSGAIFRFTPPKTNSWIPKMMVWKRWFFLNIEILGSVFNFSVRVLGGSSQFVSGQ